MDCRDPVAMDGISQGRYSLIFMRDFIKGNVIAMNTALYFGFRHKAVWNSLAFTLRATGKIARHESLPEWRLYDLCRSLWLLREKVEIRNVTAWFYSRHCSRHQQKRVRDTLVTYCFYYKEKLCRYLYPLGEGINGQVISCKLFNRSEAWAWAPRAPTRLVKEASRYPLLTV